MEKQHRGPSVLGQECVWTCVGSAMCLDVGRGGMRHRGG